MHSKITHKKYFVAVSKKKMLTTVFGNGSGFQTIIMILVKRLDLNVGVILSVKNTKFKLPLGLNAINFEWLY